MKKRLFILGAALALALTAFAAGCGKEGDMKDRVLRELPEGFKYEITYEDHTVD